MFAIIRTRWQTRPLSCRARRRSSAAPGSLRKKYAGIAYPPNMVRLPNHSTTSGNPRKPVLAAKAPVWETGDRGFEFRHPDQFLRAHSDGSHQSFLNSGIPVRVRVWTPGV